MAKPKQAVAVAVFDTEGRMLWGQRKDSGKYTAVAGGMEDNETPEQTACRELKEEANIDAEPEALEFCGEQTNEDGTVVHVFKMVDVDCEPDCKNDPDDEFVEGSLRFVDMRHGLPAKIASNLHIPAAKNAVLKIIAIECQPEDFDDENWMDFDAPHESTENLSKSIKAIPRGRKVASTHLGPIHSYSHVLSPDHIKQGYRMTVRTADFGEGSGGQEGISANLYHGKKEIGSVTGSLHHDTKTAQIKFSALDQEHRGKGLGLLAYESLLAHAHHIGIEKVRGHEHSTAASALHSALAQKHGLDYKPEPAANHSRVKPDDFDARFGPYEYMIKSFSSKNPWNPDDFKGSRTKIYDWQQGSDGKKNLRNMIGAMPKAAKARAIHRLGRVTQMRRSKLGGREFLLHRAMGEQELSAVIQNTGTISHQTSSSWTPLEAVAESFNRPNGHKVSAWIHEKDIKMIPLQMGAMKYRWNHQKQKMLGGKNEYAPEYEVIVAPHVSDMHSSVKIKTSKDVQKEMSAAGYTSVWDYIKANQASSGSVSKSEDLQPFVDGIQDPDQILKSNPSAETLDALANSSIESVSTKAKLVRGLESDVKDLLLLSPVSLPWEYATYQTRHLFLDTALPLLPRHLWNQARQAMNQTPPLNQASAHEQDLAPTDDELLQWVVQSEPISKSFRHALMGLAAASVLAHPGQIHRDAKVTHVSKLADPNLSVAAVNPKTIKVPDQKVGGGMTSERGATMHIPGKFDPANRWTMRDLPTELKALSFAETSGGLKWGHDKHSRGEFDTAYGPVGLKPSSAYENFKNSKVLTQAYPHIVTSTDFLNEFQQNPKFYNTLASKEWSRMLKDSKGNPEEAAARWRLGSAAIDKHIAAGIHPTPVIQDYISKFRAGMAKLHPKTTENTVHVASSPKVTNE